jgi:hypothetical protein
MFLRMAVERQVTPFERLVLPKVSDNYRNFSVEERQFERLRGFLEFDSPPDLSDRVDTIVVLGTSKRLCPMDFDMRVNAGMHYAMAYPESRLIVTGKRPHVSQALPEELDENYLESRVMADALLDLGVTNQVNLEKEADNTRDNVRYSLAMIPHGETSVLFITSGYLARRVSLYVNKELQTSGRSDDVRCFFVDTDVREDTLQNSSISEQEKHRKIEKIGYEWLRLPVYRRNDHI